MLFKAFFSRRLTCAWLMWISSATSVWVFPSKNRISIIWRSRSGSRVANEYCEDTLKRTEEAVALGLEEVRKARQRFKSIAK